LLLRIYQLCDSLFWLSGNHCDGHDSFYSREQKVDLLLRNNHHQLSGGGRLEETFASYNPSTVCDGVFWFSNNHHQHSGVLVMIMPVFFRGAFRRGLCLLQSINCL
jgi:hypothetical protein